jgi:hypothetical protein
VWKEWVAHKPVVQKKIKPPHDEAELFPEKARVVIKFRNEMQIPYEDGIEKQADKFQLGPFEDLAKRYAGIKLLKSFRTHAPEKLRNLTEQASELDPAYRPVNFATYFYVEIEEVDKLEELAKELRSWPTIESAYVDRAGPDPGVNPSNDPRCADQGYLDPSPDGIDAEYAWPFRGGDGTGQSIIDIERGWTLNHEDLASHGARCLHGTPLDSSRAHGTAVLGILCAEDNTLGCVGIAPNIDTVNVVSTNVSSRVDAIISAIDNLSFGDVLLLEAQVYLEPRASYPDMLGPIEVYDAEFDTIRLATALGINVVEVGGNGTNRGGTASAPAMNMDTYVNPSGRRILNRDAANPDFRDSGAIIVTAATSTAPHTRLAYAPHGRRIDCYAWGENIETCWSNDRGATDLYNPNFSGTSGASPIIAGATLIIQGIAEASLGFRFNPRQIRAILSNATTGTRPAGTETALIGVMPNLRAIIEDDIIGQAPDVYVRDFVGDRGVPHTGPSSESPDMILRPTSVANPQASFGEGSGTENSSTLGSTAEIGHDNFVYVRMRNKGGTAAINVEARVYWSEVATLVTPDLWHMVGSATIPNVPTGDLLSVSPAIVWHAAQIPAEGHYCFVGLIGNGRDPPPDSADFLEWEKFIRFIQENNNVTWRNFNVQNNDPASDPSTPKEFLKLRFLVPGAPDKARMMGLELLSRLPNESQVILEIPVAADRLVSQGLPNAKIDKERGVILLPLKSTGRQILFNNILPAKSRYRMRLLVRVPEELRKHTYSISLRQVWEKMEIGRVTWNLVPHGTRDTKRSV